MSESDKIIPYLSNDELKKLIMETESEVLVQAPSGIETNVISFIERKKRIKTLEFSRYCLRVGFAVAAAIALICIVPFVPDTELGTLSRQDVVLERNAVSREEVLGNRTVKTKEEVLNERSDTGHFAGTESFIQAHIKSLLGN